MAGGGSGLRGLCGGVPRRWFRGTGVSLGDSDPMGQRAGFPRPVFRGTGISVRGGEPRGCGGSSGSSLGVQGCLWSGRVCRGQSLGQGFRGALNSGGCSACRGCDPMGTGSECGSHDLSWDSGCQRVAAPGVQAGKNGSW